MWWISNMLAKKVLVVRYKNVLIMDRRDSDRSFTEDLYDFDFTSCDVKNVPLGKDPVWKGLVERFNRLGYDLDTPEDVVRIQVELDPTRDFTYKFERYDEELAEQTEAVNAD